MLEVQVGKTLQRKQEMSIVPGAGSPVLSEAWVYVSSFAKTHTFEAALSQCLLFSLLVLTLATSPTSRWKTSKPGFYKLFVAFK